MSFTRFHDDPSRIKKQLDESTFQGRYFLNTPGAGMDLPFKEDPHFRLQKWGANLHTNTVNIESDLHGLTRTLNRDLINKNNYQKSVVNSSPYKYKDELPTTEESRTSHPAWSYRDLERNRWETPYLNPQNNLERTFDHNIQTRILEKDSHITKVPMVGGYNNFFNGESSMCMGKNKNVCNNSKFH